MAIIYLLTNTVNGKQYVGQTSHGLDIRWLQHCRRAHRGNPQHLYNAIRKYGTDAFIREILEHTTIEDINDREIYWIAELNTKENGYNMTDGGEGKKGCVVSEETRAKMSKALSGENHPFYGKKLSVEHRAKLSASLSGANSPWYGKPRSEDTRKKISATLKEKISGANNPFYGKKHSEETKAKLRAAAKSRAARRRPQKEAAVEKQE